jgi:hypothetical protein
MEKEEGVPLEIADAQLSLFHLIATGLDHFVLRLSHRYMCTLKLTYFYLCSNVIVHFAGADVDDDV